MSTETLILAVCVTRYTLHGRGVWKFKDADAVFVPLLQGQRAPHKLCTHLRRQRVLCFASTCRNYRLSLSRLFFFPFFSLFLPPLPSPPPMSSPKGWKTDTSGEYFPGNLAAPYTSFSGPLCLFGKKSESRVYHICDRDAATPAASVVYESYYDCQVYVGLRSQVACKGQ